MNRPLITVLSTADRPERWALVFEQLDADAVDMDRVHRVNAIDGSKLDRAHIEPCKPLGMKITQGGPPVPVEPEINPRHDAISIGLAQACFIARKLRAPYLIALEDDVALPPGYIQFIEDEIVPSVAGELWDVLNLGGTSTTLTFRHNDYLDRAPLEECVVGAHCLVINRTAYAELEQSLGAGPLWGPEAVLAWRAKHRSLRMLFRRHDQPGGPKQAAMFSVDRQLRMRVTDPGWRDVVRDGRPPDATMLGENRIPATPKQEKPMSERKARRFEIPISGKREVTLELPLDLGKDDIQSIKRWIEIFGPNLLEPGLTSIGGAGVSLVETTSVPNPAGGETLVSVVGTVKDERVTLDQGEIAKHLGSKAVVQLTPGNPAAKVVPADPPGMEGINGPPPVASDDEQDDPAVKHEIERGNVLASLRASLITTRKAAAAKVEHVATECGLTISRTVDILDELKSQGLLTD